jgi:hypothetical protein
MLVRFTLIFLVVVNWIEVRRYLERKEEKNNCGGGDGVCC